MIYTKKIIKINFYIIFKIFYHLLFYPEEDAKIDFDNLFKNIILIKL